MLNKLMCFFFICAVLIRSSICEDVCNLPADTGLCRAFRAKFYYDSSEGRCKRFGYGGCAGNGNRFDTQEQCEAACPGPVMD